MPTVTTIRGAFTRDDLRMKVQSADAKPKTYHSLTDHYSYPLLDIGSCAQRVLSLLVRQLA
jgi:hypothetical protein